VAPFPASQHFGAEGQLIRRIDMVPEPYPLGYTPSMVFTQPPVEEALRDHAASYGCVEISLGTELLNLDQSETGVMLSLRSDDGQTRTVTADYVIACDGASSGVREQLGIALEDLVFDEPWLVVDMLVNEDALGKLPQTAAQYCDPARPTTFIIGPGNHRRWEIMLLPDEDPREAQQPEQVWKLLSKWLTPDDATLWRAASYRHRSLGARARRRRRSSPWRGRPAFVGLLGTGGPAMTAHDRVFRFTSGLSALGLIHRAGMSCMSLFPLCLRFLGRKIGTGTLLSQPL
jgi:3-(3-hydroxy-phenyl)propionate hydroxylase